MKAAAVCDYPAGYKYIAFYFAGHGGRDKSGKLFVKGLQLDKSNPEILHIEEYITEPLKGLRRFTRLFILTAVKPLVMAHNFVMTGMIVKCKTQSFILVCY